MSERYPIGRLYERLRVKLEERAPGAILLMRMGDFYEAFEEHADLLAEELDLVLTTRKLGPDESHRLHMAGFPWHASDGYIKRLTANGHLVAVVETTADYDEGYQVREIALRSA